MNFNQIILVSIFVVIVYIIIVLLGNTRALYDSFTHAKLEYVLIGIVLFSLGAFIRSFRWILMLRHMKIKIPLKQNIILYFTGYAFALTPGKLGEGVRAKYLKDDYQIPIEKSFPTVFSERYYDVIGVITIIFITTGFVNQNVIVYLSLGLLVFFYFVARKKNATKILSSIGKIKRLTNLTQKTLIVVDTLEVLLQPKIFLKSSIITVISWGFEALGLYFVFRSFDIDLGVAKACSLYVITSFIGAASLLPGGVGGSEGSLLGLLILDGFSYSQVLGPVLVTRFLALWYMIIIGIAFTFIYKAYSKRY